MSDATVTVLTPASSSAAARRIARARPRRLGSATCRETAPRFGSTPRASASASRRRPANGRRLGDPARRSWHRLLTCAVTNQDRRSSSLHDIAHRNLLPRSIDRGAACTCLLYTSDAADERSSVDLGG